MKILDIPRSGSVAGTTSSHNRAGQYVRNRRTPVNNPTPRRTAIRTAFGAASTQYSFLTPSEQASWTAAADAHPITDSLGQSIKLTGHQMYVSISTQMANVGEASSPSPPPSFAVFSLVGTTGSFGLVAGIQLVFSSSGAATDFILIAFSKPVPGGRTFWKTYSQYATKPGNSINYALSTALYSATFGSPVIGQKVFVRLTPVSQYGVSGVAQILQLVVAA